nr:DUF2399 domain-containing protein [Streptomyces gelaticus]
MRIAAYVLDKTRAHPWSMTAADYRAADVRNTHGRSATQGITGAPWDPALAAEAVAEYGTAVVEEPMADVLLENLTAIAPGQWPLGWFSARVRRSGRPGPPGR